MGWSNLEVLDSMPRQGSDDPLSRSRVMLFKSVALAEASPLSGI